MSNIYPKIVAQLERDFSFFQGGQININRHITYDRVMAILDFDDEETYNAFLFNWDVRDMLYEKHADGIDGMKMLWWLNHNKIPTFDKGGKANVTIL